VTHTLHANRVQPNISHLTSYSHALNFKLLILFKHTAAYIVNLVSGLILAEVAIKQQESAGTDVPASFKEFADENLDSPSASTVIAGISLFTNACVLSFDLHRAGDVANNVLGGALGPTLSMVGFASVLVALVSTQKGDMISKVASVMVMALFASFFGLLVPGLANVADPMGTFFATGSNPDIMSGITEATPIILMTMIYQNIVPTVTKILDYDRAQTTAAITLGSFLPLCLYLAWCFACVGGGVDLHSVGGPLMTVFSMTAVTGSSLGCVMSLSEEVDTFMGSSSDDDSKSMESNSDVLNAPSVAAAVGVPLIAAHLFAGGEDFTAALKIAGSYGSPMLYFCIPAIMAWTQRQKVQDLPNLVPGGSATLVGLGVASMGLMGQELVADGGSFFTAAAPVMPL
jgi:tyrosine-specific transport protein